MPESLVVVGAGGFGRETLDVAEAMNAAAPSPVWDILGVVDEAPSDPNLQRLESRGISYLGPTATTPSGARVSIGIGSPSARKSVSEELSLRDLEFATLIHPTAVIGSQVEIGTGSVICAGVSVGTNVTLGHHVHLNPHAVIGHDTTLGDHVSVNPNATLSGDCHLEDEVLIGAGSLVLQGLTVGKGTIVGGSACVVTHTAAAVVVKGVPAR